MLLVSSFAIPRVSFISCHFVRASISSFHLCSRIGLHNSIRTFVLVAHTHTRLRRRTNGMEVKMETRTDGMRDKYVVIDGRHTHKHRLENTNHASYHNPSMKIGMERRKKKASHLTRLATESKRRHHVEFKINFRITYLRVHRK